MLKNNLTSTDENIEQCVSNMLFAQIAANIGDLKTAYHILKKAIYLVQTEKDGFYKSQKTSFFAAFHITVDEESTKIILPVIDRQLVLPPFGFDMLHAGDKSLPNSAAVKNVTIFYTHLQFDKNRLISCLQGALEAESAEAISNILASFIKPLLSKPIEDMPPLTIANDSFMIASNLLNTNNLPLAKFFLKYADDVLLAYLNSQPASSKQIQNMHQEIKNIISTIQKLETKQGY